MPAVDGTHGQTLPSMLRVRVTMPAGARPAVDNRHATTGADEHFRMTRYKMRFASQAFQREKEREDLVGTNSPQTGVHVNITPELSMHSLWAGRQAPQRSIMLGGQPVVGMAFVRRCHRGLSNGRTPDLISSSVHHCRTRPSPTGPNSKRC